MFEANRKQSQTSQTFHHFEKLSIQQKKRKIPQKSPTPPARTKLFRKIFWKIRVKRKDEVFQEVS